MICIGVRIATPGVKPMESAVKQAASMVAMAVMAATAATVATVAMVRVIFWAAW